MLEKLKIKAIYDDFLIKVNLTDDQIKILDYLIKKETIVKISREMNMSERSVGYEIKKIKDAYASYKQLELSKLLILMD